MRPPADPGTETHMDHRLHTLEGRFGANQFQQLLELMAEQTGGAVFAVDVDNTVVYWSSGATRLLGRNAEQAIGTHCLRSVPCPDCLASCALRSSEPPHPAQIVRADETSHFERYVFPMHDDDGSFLGGIELLVPAREAVRLGSPEDVERFGTIGSRDSDAAEAVQLARRLAPTDAPLYLQCPDPALRLQLAAEIHGHSGRMGRFVALDTHRGPFDVVADLAADPDGTVYVDPFAALPLSAQGQLFRTLSDARPGVYGRLVVGDARTPEEEARAGRLRPELAAVFRGMCIPFPPLGRRTIDLADLVSAELARLNARTPSRRPVATLEAAALEVLAAHDWPGETAELRAVATFAWTHATTSVHVEDLPPYLLERTPSRAPATPEESARQAREARRIRNALREADGNMSAAAEALGISRATLYRRRRKLGV